MHTREVQTRAVGRRTIVGRRARLQRPPFFLLWPSLVLLLGIVGIPFLIGLYTSLTGLDQYTIAHWTSAPFVGLQNYIDGFTKGNALGASLPGSIWASLSFSIVTTLVILPIGVGAALLMNTAFPGRGAVRSIFLIPFVMPPFVNAITWRLLFMTGWGPIDRILATLHLADANTYWLIGPKTFWAMVMADVTRVSDPRRSRASCRAMALMTVASIPM